jgi:diguanylate cyclase (GGDEF)-like protein
MTLDNFLPVSLVTVKTDTASRVEGLRIGADDYVCKPFEEAELLARVQSMLRIKRLHEQIVLQKARFERLSVHDELTGLYNFRFLHTRLSEEFKRAERYHEPFASVLVDIDQLRAFNDTGGRSLGDAAIRRVADAIRRSVREVDVVARYGGEEFLAVLPSTHFAGSVAVAERIWREVGASDFGNLGDITAELDASYDGSSSGRDAKWSEGPRRLTVSIGVALYPSRDVRTKDALIRAAEAALSQAKREGGDRICVFQQQGYIYTPVALGNPQTHPTGSHFAMGGEGERSVPETRPAPPPAHETWPPARSQPASRPPPSRP